MSSSARTRWLAGVALLHLAVLAVLIVLMLIDERQMTGVSLWLKPAKFAASIAVYLLTMAWLIDRLEGSRLLLAIIAAIIIGAMVLEQFLITLQAARGTTSHYNNATAFDSQVFSLMGFGVAANALAAAAVLVLYQLRPPPEQQIALIWGIRMGLFIFLLGSVQGFVMIANGGHTVGGTDGGPGIPLVAWSKMAGDLRVAHFVGIHAIQVLPLAGWLIDRYVHGLWPRCMLVTIAALAWLSLGLWTHWMAMAGRSLFSWT